MKNIKEKLKKAVILVPKTNLILQEFLALIAGIKPVINFKIDAKQAKLIKTDFPELKIIYGNAFIWNKNSRICAISYNKSLAQKTINSFCGSATKLASVGNLLGYPQCCVEGWLKHINNGQQHNHNLVTYQSYQATSKCSPFTNNLLNFSTRVGDKDVNDFLHYQKSNLLEGAPSHYLQFISHIPCRYDCAESIKMGKAIDALLSEYAPATEKVVKDTLSKPILFFDIFKLVIFDGYIKKGILYYQKIIPPIFAIENPLKEMIKNGNRIIVEDKKIEIFKDNSTLFIYPKKSESDGFLLDFSTDEARE